MILIRHNGEMHLVESLDAYPDAEVLAHDVEDPKHPNHHWDGQALVPHPVEHPKAARRAKFRALETDELIDMFEAKFATLNDRLNKLESKPHA